MYNFTENDINQMVNMYRDRSTLKEIAFHFSTYRGKIKEKLVKRKIKLRNRTCLHSLNPEYFKNIDSEKKAYFLGFIFADGCVYENKKKTKISGLIIQIQERDREIIDEFKKDINSTHNISFVEPQIKTWQRKVVFTFSNIEFVSHLVSKGCLPRKSQSCFFPKNKLDNKYFRHFIRGYFDGDGSICSTSDYYVYPTIRICATLEFAEEIKNIVRKKLDINTGIFYKKSSIYDVEYSKVRAMKFLDWIYQDATMYLKRKYNRYLFFKKYYQFTKGRKNRIIREKKWKEIKNNY